MLALHASGLSTFYPSYSIRKVIYPDHTISVPNRTIFDAFKMQLEISQKQNYLPSSPTIIQSGKQFNTKNLAPVTIIKSKIFPVSTFEERLWTAQMG